MFISISEAIKKRYHTHEWSAWERQKPHYWEHAEWNVRYCRTCPEKEYSLIYLHCPQKKIKGEYCGWCKGWGEVWDKGLDKMSVVGNNDAEHMKKTGKPRRGRPPMLARNIAMAIEYEFHPEWSVRQVGKRHDIPDPKTAWTAINIGRRYINMEAIKEAVG